MQHCQAHKAQEEPETFQALHAEESPNWITENLKVIWITKFHNFSKESLGTNGYIINENRPYAVHDSNANIKRLNP
ncbi:unnamed protein product [Sphenostylis stenocarpa]|uniref:Uncharacterized protein n=1 Tax=Sphenostylis stenocarpa TaxID=92480 RepID=A0AA86SZP8_9FABA|nr:unnamed protein product [Sphenostylis stenocarpa]